MDELTEEEGVILSSNNIVIDARTGEVFKVKNIKPGDVGRFDALAGLTRANDGALLTRD